MTNSGILSEPVLVGRESELEELQRYLDLAIHGQGKIVFVSGEAGSGKTKLVTDFLNSAKQKVAVTTLKGWCLSDAGIPYFPFIEAFSNYYSSINHENLGLASEKAIENEESEVNTWLKGPVRMGLSGTVEFSPETWKDLTFAAVRHALTSISAKSPTVLFLDDIQWADSASLALLHYISRTLTSQKLLVLAAFRKEDLKEDDKGHPHPLVEALRLMRRDSLFQEVKLSGLNRTDVRLLAEHLVGGNVQSSLAEKLENDSQGNPLFIVESLRMLSEKQCLVINKDRWCLSTDEIGVPTKIKDIILNRVNRLKPNEKKLLEVASVVGSKFFPELLASVLDMDNLQVIEILDGISQASSLVSCEGNYYRFDHVKSRDIVYEEISQALKKAYHSKIAERLEATSTTNQVSDLAYHFAQAGNKSKAIKYSLAAGQEALSFILGTEAIKHFKYVLDNVSDDPSFLTQRETAMEGLGDGLFANGRSESIKVFEELRNSASSNEVMLRATRKAAHASLIEGNYARALELVSKTTARLPENKLENARFLAVKGWVEGWGGFGAKALEDLQQALEVFEKEYSILDMIDALTQECIAFIILRAPGNPASLGQPENALASVIRSLALSDTCQHLPKQVDGNTMAFIIHNKCALPKEATEVVEASFKAVQKIGDPVSRTLNESTCCWMRGFLTEVKAMDKILAKLPMESMNNFGTGTKLKFYIKGLLSGTLMEFRQDLKNAAEQSQIGADLAEETDFFEGQALVYSNLTREYASIGQMKQADIYFEKMEKIFRETTLTGFVFANVIHLFTKGVYFASKHQWEESNNAYEEAIDFYLSFSPPTGIMAGIRRGYCWALLQQGRFNDAKRQFEESKKTMDELESRLVHSNIHGFVIAPATAQVDREFNVRLDLINVAKNPSTKVEVKDLVPTKFKILSSKPLVNLKDASGNFEVQQIKPFKDEALTLTIKATEAGSFKLNPIVTYLDEFGTSKTCVIKPVAISIQPAQPSAIISQQTLTNPSEEKLKPYSVFLCYKKSSGRDFADHLKTGLEELGLHTFQDSKDIPQMVAGQEEWARIRDKALEESKIFILLMTPGFELSSEVIKELSLARKVGNKEFIYFRHRNLGRKTLIQLENEVLEFSKLEQVSFETKEELLRLAHNILYKESIPQKEPSKAKISDSDTEIDILKKFGLLREKSK